jgi:hypothetical protein
METFIAAVAALGAACTFGVSSVLMFRAASAAPEGDLLRLRLLARLARTRLWLTGVVLEATSFGIQGVALAFGPLVLVQPLAGTDLLFALPLLARYRRRRMHHLEMIGALLVAGGVAVFLAVSPPTAGAVAPPLRDWLLPMVGVGGVVTAASVFALRVTGVRRTTLLAVAGAIDFALVDALSKSFVDLLRHEGLATTLLRWEPYALLCAGIVGLVLSQSAFQSGSLVVSLPIIDTLEPVGAVVLGAIVFGERLAGSPILLAVQLAGAAVAVLGIAVLDRSPVVRGTANRPAIARVEPAARRPNTSA